MTASWRWGIGWAKYISLDGEVLAVLKPILSGLARIELRETANCGVIYEG